jgi:hypothetical protein
MIGLVLALSGLILLGAAVALWLRRSRADSGPARPVSTVLDRDQDLLPESGNDAGESGLATVLDRDQDLLPESGNDAGESGLAAFYAYQMAAGKIHRQG